MVVECSRPARASTNNNKSHAKCPVASNDAISTEYCVLVEGPPCLHGKQGLASATHARTPWNNTMPAQPRPRSPWPEPPSPTMATTPPTPGHKPPPSNAQQRGGGSPRRVCGEEASQTGLPPSPTPQNRDPKLGREHRKAPVATAPLFAPPFQAATRLANLLLTFMYRGTTHQLLSQSVISA